MLKFSMPRKNGGNLLGFGITEANIEKLKAGQPIYVELSELGIEGYDMMIMYGKDQRDVQRQLKEAGAWPKDGPEVADLP